MPVEMHESFRSEGLAGKGVPALHLQNYIATAAPGAPVLGQVAQLVEQRTENPRVGSSILPLAIFINDRDLEAARY